MDQFHHIFAKMQSKIQFQHLTEIKLSIVLICRGLIPFPTVLQQTSNKCRNFRNSDCSLLFVLDFNEDSMVSFTEKQKLRYSKSKII